jgi:hypothetical protein
MVIRDHINLTRAEILSSEWISGDRSSISGYDQAYDQTFKIAEREARKLGWF